MTISQPKRQTYSGIRDNLERGSVGQFLQEKIETDSKLSIVSAYFTIYAYAALKPKLDNATIRWQTTAGLRQIGGAQVAGVLQAFINHTTNPTAQAEAEKLLQSFA